MSTQGSPNILLIIADDLGKDVVEVTGSGTSRAMQVHTNDGTNDIYGALPNISRLLRNGLSFEQAWAQPACSPTRASIYTGLHPWKSGVGSPMGTPELDSTAGFATIPSLLPAGYRSGLFGKWHLGSQPTTRPTDHGWNKHVGTLGGVIPAAPRGYSDWDIVDSDTGYVATATTDYATKRTVDEAVAWINSLSSTTPWFVTMAFHTPHDPFHIPVGGYDAATVGIQTSDDYMFNLMAQNLDFNLGRLLGLTFKPELPPTLPGRVPVKAAKSIREGELQNTIIIFIGDNGSFRDISFEEYKTQIYEGGLRVPMIIADGQAVLNERKGEPIVPRFLHASKLNATYLHMVHVVDLYKTIVRLADPTANSFPSDSDSTDFSGLLKTAARLPGLLDLPLPPSLPNVKIYPILRRFNFSQWYASDGTRAAIRNARYKLNYDSNPSRPEYALFEYTGLAVPGSEDDGTAVDLYNDAVTGVNQDALDNLNLLLDELLAHYQRDETDPFPDPRPF
jgi:hypothetical protein